MSERETLDYPATWEVRVALDYTFGEFMQGLQQRPTKKPILLFLPKGASEFMLAFCLKHTTRETEAVCLVEDADTASAVDRAVQRGPDLVRGRSRVVLGDLATLAKTDAGSYGGCVVLAYGSKSDHKHAYLSTETSHVSRLCGRSAHLLCVEQPMQHASETTLAEFYDPILHRKLCGVLLQCTLSVLSTQLSHCRRRVTFGPACLVGNTATAAASYCMQLMRVERTNSKKPFADVSGALLTDEAHAIQEYRNRGDDDHAFMQPETFKDWMGQSVMKRQTLSLPR